MRADCMMDIQIAMSQAKRAGHDVDAVPYGYALIDESRNACVAKYSDGADFVVFIDDDMKPEPEAINKIVALNAPIASAICTTRSEPTDLVLLEWVDERGGFVKCHTIPMHKPVTKRFGVGGAFLCIRKDALEQIKEYYLSARDWIDWFQPEHDRMHVRKEKREEERKAALRKALRVREQRLEALWWVLLVVATAVLIYLAAVMYSLFSERNV